MNRWEHEMRRFERSDRRRPPAPGAAVFVGGSSIRFWAGLQRHFPFLRVLNRGFGGATLADVRQAAGRIIVPYDPCLVVLYAGENDLVEGADPDDVLAALEGVAAELAEKRCAAPLVLLGLKPSPGRRTLWTSMQKVNEGFRCAAVRRGRQYIDLWKPMLAADGTPRADCFRADGVHMTATGYGVWRDELVGPLRRLAHAVGAL